MVNLGQCNHSFCTLKKVKYQSHSTIALDPTRTFNTGCSSYIVNLDESNKQRIFDKCISCFVNFPMVVEAKFKHKKINCRIGFPVTALIILFFGFVLNKKPSAKEVAAPPSIIINNNNSIDFNPPQESLGKTK